MYQKLIRRILKRGNSLENSIADIHAFWGWDTVKHLVIPIGTSHPQKDISYFVEVKKVISRKLSVSVTP